MPSTTPIQEKHHYDFALRLDDPVSTHAIQFSLVPEGSRVLDVGCHTGILGEALTARKGCSVVGIDMDDNALRAASERLDAVRAIDLERTGWTDTLVQDGLQNFDVILFGDVLEHTRDPLPILKEARTLLAPGASVIVSLPNIANLRVRLQLLRGRFEYQDAGILDHGHLRFFTRKTARALLEAAGYAISDERFSGYSLPRWLIDRFPELFAVNVILIGKLK